MKLFHGSFSDTAPVIKIGSFSLSGDNVFDGIFASTEADIAGSHGQHVHTYTVNSIADNAALNANIDGVISFLLTEIEADAEQIVELANALADDKCDDAFSEILAPRTDYDAYSSASWEMQRLRGRVAAYLGFDAVEMEDEHGTSYLIVNPNIVAE